MIEGRFNKRIIGTGKVNKNKENPGAPSLQDNKDELVFGLNENEVQFLKELQHEMRHQPTDYQAAPRFWVLRQYEYEPTGEDWMDKYEYYYSDGDYISFDEIEELIEFLLESEIVPENIARELKHYNLDEAFTIIMNEYNGDGYFDAIPVVKVERIIPNTLFLTKESAKEHIRLNHYHYNETIHTYAMTAWRSPEVSLLFKIIDKIDFGEEKL